MRLNLNIMDQYIFNKRFLSSASGNGKEVNYLFYGLHMFKKPGLPTNSDV